MKGSMRKGLLLGGLAFLGGAVGCSPAAAQQSPGGAAPATAQRALLDRYCVGCHNDKARTANLSLQNLDLATAGGHHRRWEKETPKLSPRPRAPPGVRRRPLGPKKRLSARVVPPHRPTS